MRTGIILAMCALSGFGQTPRAAAMAGGSYIGVMMQEVDSERAKALKLHEEGGVEITVVEKDGPAEKAGLKVGDVVLRYNAQRVEGMQQFARMVHDTPAGHEVKVEISRGGATQIVMVRVAQRRMPRTEWSVDQTPMAMERWDIRLPDMPRAFMTLHSSALGADAESIDGQLAQYFGVKEGVLIRAVTKGAAADRAGIRAGDVIIRIDDARVTNPAELSGKLRSRGKSTPIVLMRDRKELTVTVTIGEDDPAGRIQITPFEVHQP